MNKINLTILITGMWSAAFGQLTGTKNIPGDYATITSAVTALNAAGVGTGGVTFNIAAGYTETITSVIAVTATGTTINPVTFQKDPSTSGANPLITAYTGGVGTPATAVQDGIMRFSGSDYITVDGIDLRDNPLNILNPSTMEYGFALYKASTSNGCQNITIKNCVITLNSINNATGTAPMADGSTGIIVMNALATTATTAMTPIAGGTHSNNKFYTNTIKNCNTGIALIGYAAASPFTLADAGNDVGGSSVATGNTIINYGGAISAANPATAIRTLAQYGINISYNTINNNNGSGSNHATTLRGILMSTATSANATISYNTITLSGAGTTQNITGIENAAGSTAASNTINISNNTITNCTYSTATTGGFYGILNSATPATLTISANTISNNSLTSSTSGFLYGITNSGAASSASITNNNFTGNTTAGITTGLFIGVYNSAPCPVISINSNTLAGNSTTITTAVYYAIYNTGAVTTTLNINSNNIGNSTTGAFTFNAVNSGSQIFINSTLATSASALSISNNNFQGINYAVAGSGTNTYISNTAATKSQAINNNTFTALNINTTGNITFIANSVVVSSTGTQNVNGNSIVTSFTKTGVGGTVTFFTSSATCVAGSVINNNNNNFSNVTVSGATVITGWINTDAGSFTKRIQNNIFNNWTGGTGTITGMSVNLTGTNNITSGNTISSITSAGAITGITTAAGNDSICANTIYGLSSSAAASVIGISVTSGTTKFIFSNKIYDLSNSNAAGTVYGISVSGTTSGVITANVFNNIIGDLRTPAGNAVDPVRGISITSTKASSSVNVYYNTIYLNASSTGATFGTTGIYHTASATTTTAALSLSNNIVQNLSIANGTGLTVAYRRSSTSLGNYMAASNNNLFYAGTPSASKLIFNDATNSDQTLAAFKTRMATRDAQSYTEDMITDLKFLSVTGSSSNYLHLDATKATLAESGGIAIAGYKYDVDGQIRFGNTGYAGTGTASDIGADEFSGITAIGLSGSYNLGSGQTFTSLTAAGGLFAVINSRGLSGNVTVNITSDLSEDGSNVLFQWLESGIGNYTLTIQPSASTARVISGDVAAGLIRFNGADRVVIDGSNGTTNKYLTFRNTNTLGTTGTAFTFLNGASSNTIRYCTIEAYTNATNGAILFSTSTIAGGNSSNTIQNCNINATIGSNTGNICIYSTGTVGNENSSNTISNSNIYNYRDRAIDITATGSTGWTISGNSFYNGDVTSAINYASASTLHGIRILGGKGYLISNNYIGGNAASAGGTSASYASTLGNVSYQAISLTTTAATPASYIKGNTIANITLSSVPTVAASTAFTGIETNGSGITIGGSLAGEGNLIGSNTINGSVNITTTTGTNTFTTNIKGINCNSTGGVVIGNQVGSFDIKNIGAAPAPSTFIGINISNATAPTQVNTNIIGSTGAGAAANSIRVLTSSTSTTTALRGIIIAATVTSAVQVDGNIIQNISHLSTVTTVTPGGIIGIQNASIGASAVTITNNTVTALTISSYSTGLFYGIYNSGACTSISINTNTISGNSTPAAAGVYLAINNAGAVTTAININANNIGNSTTGAFTFSAANSGAQIFINNTAGAATCALSISNNNFQGITYSVAGSSTNTYILNSAATKSQSINSNTFTNLSINTTGSVTFISNSVIVPSTGTQNVNSNSISGTFTKSGAGTVTLFTSSASSVSGSVISNSNNNFSNITVTSTAIIAGWVNTDAGASAKTIQNNIFTNWTAATGAVTAMSVSLTGTNNSVSGNVINNISGGGAVTGITTGAGNDNIYSNTINTLSSSAAAAVTGISVTGGTAKNIYKNKIYDLQASNATGTVNGILVSGTTIVTINIYNNLIGDLKTPAGSGADPVRGISVIATATGSTVNVYFNTVYISTTSSATNWGSTGIYHTTSATATVAALNLRNNSITNTSTAKGTGFTVAYRRSTSTLTNYASSSNNNLFYAGVPFSNRLIFYDGTNSDQTLATFKTRVSTRDAASVTEDLSLKFLSTTGSSSLFLHINASSPTIIEGSAVNITGFTDDFDSQIRAGNIGYVGSNTTPDIGADEITGIEIIAPSITYTALTNTTSTVNRDITGITITDASGINNNAGTKPRIYYKRFSDANVWLDNTSATNGWKYTEATNSVSPYTFTINYSLLFGGSSVTAGVIQYFIVAGDLAAISNIAINSGTFAATPSSVALTSAAFPISGTINSYNIPFSGSYNIGTGEVFTSLTKTDGLFTSINSVGLMDNVTLNIVSDITEDGTNALNQWTESGTGNYKLVIQPDGTILRTISGNVLSGLIRLNGADRVRVDGTNGGSGLYLTFRNTNTAGTTGTAFTFSGGATTDTIRYCNIEAYANAINGVILFSTSAVAGGNSNNVIDNCAIKATVSSNTSNVVIYSAGTTGNENSANIISNNTIYNYRDRAIDITSAGSTGWVISGNSFYNGDIAAVINYAAATALHGIRISGGSGYSIVNNYIGGNAVLASGTSAAYSSTLGNLSYQGILLSTSAALPSSVIKGNTITKISISSVPTAANANPFTGIETNGSGIITGGSLGGEGNIIGSNTLNSSISVTTTTSSSLFTSNITGINCLNTGGSVIGNLIGGIDIKNIGAAPASSSFTGIFVNSATPPSQVNNNTVGSTGTGAASNSIAVLASSTATTTTLSGICLGPLVSAGVEINNNLIENISNFSTTSSGSFNGILNISTAPASAITITNNTIKSVLTAANANAGSTIYTGISSSSPSVITGNIIDNISLVSTGNAAQIRGISVSGANIFTISNNTLSNFLTASTKTADIETGAPSGFNITGVLNSSSVSGQVISENNLYNFSSTTTAVVNTAVTGIAISTSSSAGNIYNNRISAFTNKANGTSTLPGISGIMASNGVFTVYNNSVKLSNTGSSNGVKIYGINHSSSSSWNYYYNSVSINGSQSATTARSAAFIRTINGGLVLNNNIFINTRTGTGSHYAISNIVSPASTNWPAGASDYNDLYSSNAGTTGEWGAGADKNFAQWQTASAGGAHSISRAISFVSSSYDLQPDANSNCATDNIGTPITSPFTINTDITGGARNATTPDPGAYEFTYTAFTLLAGSNSPVCTGDSVILSVNSGSAISPVYSWINPLSAIVSTQQNPVVPVMPGEYKITVTDVNGCFVTDSTLVSINARPTAALTSETSICDSAIVNLNITVTGTGTISGTLNNGDNFTGTAPLIILPVSVTESGSYSISSLTDDNCTAIAVDFPDAVTINVTHKGDWFGINNNWNDPINWCEGEVPTATTNVTIPIGTIIMPLISGNAYCDNLTINTGTSLTISGTGVLNIGGTLTNAGTINNTGTINFNGTSGQQTFSGISSFYNVILSNTDGLLLPSVITINNDLTLSSGVMNANNYNISIKGNWVNNASTTAFNGGTATVTFNSTNAQTIGGTFATQFNNLTISNTGNTVTLLINTGISGNLSVSSGIFDLAIYTANRISAGGILTVANSAKLKIGGTNTYPSNYTTNTLVVASTVEYSGTNQTVSNQLYGNLTLSSSTGAAIKTLPASSLIIVGNFNSNIGSGTSVSYTAASNITINGTITIGLSTTFNGGSFSHSIGSNWINNGTFNGNTSTVSFIHPGIAISGSGVQNFNNIIIAGSGISFPNSAISLSGNLTTTGPGAVSQTSGGTLMMTGISTSITGTGISLDNLTISGSVSTTSSFDINGNLSVSGSFSASTGTIILNGISKTISGAGSIHFSSMLVTGSLTTTANLSISSALTVSGSFSASTGTTTFTGTSSFSGIADLYNVAINGTSLQLSSTAELGIAGALTITTGSIDVTTTGPNTINFNGSVSQNVNGINYSNLVLSNGNTKTATGAITTAFDITIGAGTTFDPSTFTHSLYGNWINNGTFLPGSSNVQFLGSATAYITGSTTFNILTSNTTSSSTELILENNVSAAIVDMINGTLLTESDTLTITGTRTGNGFIRGHIRRNHAFTTGISYAFESPDNTITFSSVSSVDSIIVSVAEEPVADFPFGASVNREYTVDVPAGAYNATLRLHYEDDELNGNDESSMTIWKNTGSSWTSTGKSANSTTSNYVEQSGLTDITGRWTYSDNANVVEWNGSVSSDWHNAANWTVIQGSASTPPSAYDIVELGTVAFTYQPIISTNEATNNILFGSVQTVTLTFASGGSLTVAGNISGDWSSSALHAINVNDQTLTVNGDIFLSDGIGGHTIDLTIGAGTITTLGSLSQTGGAGIIFLGGGTLNIFLDFTYTSGDFIPGTGTVIYNGVQNQHVAHVNYNNITINKAGGIAEIDTMVNISGNLTITAGELDNFDTAIIAGDVTIGSGAIFQNNNIVHVGGNWNNSGSFTGAGIKIIFDGGGTQTISATTFNNLEINKPAASLAYLTGDVILNGNLVGTSGILDIKSFFFNRLVVGGSATISDASTLIIATDNAPNKFASYSLSAGSTVIFNGTTTQHLLLPGVVYGNLIFRNSGTKILYTPITVNGNLTIESTATFDGGAQTITLNGNWINSGTYTPSTSTLLCSGTSKTISGATTFNRFTVTGSYTLLNNTTFNNLLNITSTGSLSCGSTINTTLNGDLINSGTLYSLGTTTFTGSVVQTLSLIDAITTVALTVNFNGTVSPVLNSTSVPQFGFININNTGGVNPSVGWTILYALTVGSGASFNGGISTHNILGSLINNGTITSAGVLNFIPSSAVTLNFGSGFTSTGTVILGGSGLMTLSGTPVSFSNLTISNTNAGGITLPSDLTIANNFTISGGSVLNAGNHIYSVGGNLSNSGTVNSGTSTFNLNGTASQTISGMTMYNMNAVNTGGVVTLLNATINNNLGITAGTLSIGNDATPRIISVTGNITIAGGATLNVASASDATHTLIIAGDITNNGTLNLHTDINSLCNTIFNKNGVQTVSGSGTTAFNTIDINQGVLSSNFADFTATDFTAPSGFLTLHNGTFKLNSEVTITPFTADITTGNFLIPSTAGLWVNAGVVNSADMNWTIAGLIKVTGGTLNLGSMENNAVVPKSTANFIITGGILNTASNISNSGTAWSMNMQGGLMTINTMGSTSAGIAAFNMDATDCIFDVTGGKIIIRNTAGTASENLAYTNLSTSGAGFTGGILQMGDTLTAGVQTMNINSTGAVYDLAVSSPDVSVLFGTDSLVISNDVTIDDGALNVYDDQKIKIGGYISNNDIFNAKHATVELNGIYPQSIPDGAFTGDTIKNLIINNNDGVTLEGDLNITGVLSLPAGEFNADGYLTLISDSASTALIDGSGAGEVLGNVTIQRYLVSGYGYKYISSPFQSATVGELSDDLDLSASFPSFYSYEENLASSGWQEYTNSANTLNPMEGYAGNFGTSNAPKTIDITGVVNNNTVSIPALYNHNQPFTQGFNLVGNPYPSPINWNAASGWDKTNIDDAIYYFDASSTDVYGGTYSSYINSISSDGVANEIIPAMQGFFIHVSDGAYPVAGELTITNDARLSYPSSVFHRDAYGPQSLVRIAAKFENAAADPVVIYFNTSAPNVFDKSLDAVKLMNTNEGVPNLYAEKDNMKLSIDAMQLPDSATSRVPLGIEVKHEGWVHFTALDLEYIPSGLHVYLSDAETGIIQDIELQPDYKIYLEAGTYANRYTVIFSKDEITSAGLDDLNLNAYYADGNLTVNTNFYSENNTMISMSNMTGQIVWSQLFTGNGSYPVEQHLSGGVYIVYIGSLSKKILIAE